MRSFILASMIAVAAGATAADAAVTVSGHSYAQTSFSPAQMTATVVNFENTVMPSGFTLSGTGGYGIRTGNDSYGAAPAIAAGMYDPTHYLSVWNGAATLASTTGYNTVSFMWGSMDGYNALDLLDASGGLIKTIHSSDIPGGTDGNQSAAWTNQTVTIHSDAAFYGLRLSSYTPAFEADDFRFTKDAVPEPASWALMLGGFGAIGGALRQRRKVAFAAA